MEKYLRTAIKVVKEAGSLAMELKQGCLEVKEKSSIHDIVTKADVEVENFIVDSLLSEFPETGVLAEEREKGRINEQYYWIIDPIDGTNNYAANIPIFCIAVALANKKNVLLGIVHDPSRNETFYASRNKGAFLNGKKLKIEDVEPEKAICALPISARRPVYETVEVLLRARKFRAIRLLGSSELQLAWLACNRLNGMVHTFLKPWDAAAGSIIAKEAGAKITNFAGREWKIDDKTLIAGSPKVYNALKETFFADEKYLKISGKSLRM